MTVEHDRQGKRFVARLDEGEAELAYREQGEGVLDLVHTFVPPGARGRGVAGALVEQALSRAREDGSRVVATCPFVRAWLQKHPDQADIVVDA